MKVTVCIGSSCHLKGSRRVIEIFQKLIDDKNLNGAVELNGTFCMGQCSNGVGVRIDGEYHSVEADEAESFFEKEILAKL